MHDCTNIKPKSGRIEGLFISNTMTVHERERERLERGDEVYRKEGVRIRILGVLRGFYRGS
jgi:hypothetical protein